MQRLDTWSTTGSTHCLGCMHPVSTVVNLRFWLSILLQRLDRHDVEHHKEVTVLFLADASR